MSKVPYKKILIGIGIAILIAYFGVLIYLVVTFYNCASLKFLEGKAKATEFLIYTEFEDEIRIIGLTDSGKSEKYIIIPEFIDEKPVRYIGCGNGLDASAVDYNFGSYENAQFSSNVLKKIFICGEITSIGSGSWGTPALLSDSENFEGIFLISDSLQDLSINYNSEQLKVYCHSDELNLYHSLPNLCYDYNYSDSPNNGIYWVDNYDYGDYVEYIPDNPLREGYVFGGWYKDVECSMKWDFETDTLPEQIFDDDGKEIYQETKLYAKWIKNS